MKMTLGQKILTGFIVCAMVLASVAIFSFRNSEKFIDTNKWVNHTHEVMYEFEQVVAAATDIQTGARGYIITGDESFLGPFIEARDRVYQHLDKVKALTFDNPTQQQNIADIKKQIAAIVNFQSELVGLSKDSFEKAKSKITSGEGEELQNNGRRMIANAIELENSLLVDRRRASAEDANAFNMVFIVLMLIIGVVLVAVYLIINTNLKALRKAEEESANKNWLLTGSFDLNEKTRGERESDELAGAVIEQLCIYLKAQIGALYLFENGQLQLSGTYAFSNNKLNKISILPGEGLVGQAASGKKTIVLTQVPENYFNIHSGLGNKTPSTIILVPLLQDDTIRGVIEIGSIKVFSDLDMQFLNMVAENLAIVFTAAQSRTKLKEFLEETQRQAEELEAQQEELKQSNEELLEKTGLLERSESQLKAQQEELQQTNEELEEKANLLEEQKDKLENAKMDIENKARELEITGKYKSEFLANMSHELRTPLNSILILSQLLSENKNKSLAEKEVEFSKNIYNSGADLLNLINEILDLSKVESGKMELDIGEFPLSGIARAISAMFTEVAKNKSIDFTIQQNTEELQSMESDMQRIEQVIRNLLSNAFKFTDKEGHVTFNIYKANKNRTYKNQKLSGTENIIAFEVSDTGIGIPEDKLGIVFEAFQQADGSTKRKYGGTGLGLSISRELANALGGEIQVKSMKGAGSTFTLFLPQKFDAELILSTENKVELKERNKVSEVKQSGIEKISNAGRRNTG